ncbi:hypothetical protein SO694_000066114 [Aureococcus anophagefferens]|uniref:Uncharacterized protein n=1 Tax=Aureococcus anophagefferens TaxID=44056 RepID=A0ABR1GAJ7_AURAN
MITCALLSRCSGSLSLIATSWALAGFWARKGVCPWWTVVVPLKNFCPRATVASAHASLNRSCSVVELFQALVLCFYQLQAAAVVVGRSAAESSNGGCEAQAALFQLASLGAVVAHGVGLQRAVLRLVVFGEPSSGIQRRFRRYATLGSGAAVAASAAALALGSFGPQAHLAWCWIGGDAENEAHALGFGLWVVLAFLYAFWVHSRVERALGRTSRASPSPGAAASLESFADEGLLEEDEEKKVCATRTLDKVALACAADADAHDDPAAATDADVADARALWDDALADDELRRERAAGAARCARGDLACVSYASLDAVEGSDHRAVGAGFSLRTDAARRDLFRGSVDSGAALPGAGAARPGGAASPSPPPPRAAPEFPLQFRAVVETTAHLVDRAQDYPPWLRRVQLDYDYVNKRARAAVLLGLDAGKNFTRRYDAAQEYATNGAAVDGAYVPLMTYDFVEFEAVAPAEAAFDLDAPWTKATCDRHAAPGAGAAAARARRPAPPSQVGGWPYLHLFHHYLMV